MYFIVVSSHSIEQLPFLITYYCILHSIWIFCSWIVKTCYFCCVFLHIMYPNINKSILSSHFSVNWFSFMQQDIQTDLSVQIACTIKSVIEITNSWEPIDFKNHIYRVESYQISTGNFSYFFWDCCLQK